jgi:hypothetical protein
VVARIRGRLGARALLHLLADGLAGVQDPDPGGRRQEPRRQRRQERVLHLAEVAHDADVEGAVRGAGLRRRPDRRAHGRRRLVDQTRPRAQSGGNAFECQRLQDHDPRSGRESGARLGARREVLVQVGASQRDDQGRLRPVPPEALDRRVALPGVQRDEELARLVAVLGPQGHAMTEPAEHARPSQRGHAVALARVPRRRSDEEDPHSSPARLARHVRNPQNTSRRSGV